MVSDLLRCDVFGSKSYFNLSYKIQNWKGNRRVVTAIAFLFVYGDDVMELTYSAALGR